MVGKKGMGRVNICMTREVLQALVEYNPWTGQFTNRATKKKMGSEASESGVMHYSRINIGGKLHYAHRVAFYYMTGVVPDVIDHVNGDGLDNRWKNLRSVSHIGNARNRKMPSNNKTGILGVYYISRVKKWAAVICNKEIIRTEDYFEACCRRKSAENALNFVVRKNAA